MKKTGIMTDSHSGILQSEADELGIGVLPMPFYIDEKLDREGVDISREEFYDRLRKGVDVSTSQPSPELAKDIIHAGIYITGGGSKIQNLDQLFTEITNIKVNTCDDPEESAVRGLSKIATDSKYKRIPFSMKNNNLK